MHVCLKDTLHTETLFLADHTTDAALPTCNSALLCAGVTRFPIERAVTSWGGCTHEGTNVLGYNESPGQKASPRLHP